jgi:predicted RNase H-like HicB family nuclease
MENTEHKCIPLTEKNADGETYIVIYKWAKDGKWHMFMDFYYDDEQSTERDFLIHACPFCGVTL